MIAVEKLAERPPTDGPVLDVGLVPPGGGVFTDNSCDLARSGVVWLVTVRFLS